MTEMLSLGFKELAASERQGKVVRWVQAFCRALCLD